MRLKTIALVFISCSVFGLKAQDAVKKRLVDLFDKSQSIYEKTPNYSVQSNFKLFVSTTSNEVKETYEGLIIKFGNKMYTKIGNTEFVLNNKTTLKIDNTNKRMQVKSIKEADNPLKSMDIKSYLNYFATYTIDEQSNQWVCPLTTAKVTMIPYSKVVIYINKENYQIAKQLLYMLTKYQTKMVKGVPQYNYPRLEITMSNFKTTVENTSYFDLENYIVAAKGKYTLVKKYKNYLIVD